MLGTWAFIHLWWIDQLPKLINYSLIAIIIALQIWVVLAFSKAYFSLGSPNGTKGWIHSLFHALTLLGLLGCIVGGIYIWWVKKEVERKWPNR